MFQISLLTQHKPRRTKKCEKPLLRQFVPGENSNREQAKSRILLCRFNRLLVFSTQTLRLLQPFYGKRPHPSLCAGSRVACEKRTISGIPNCLNYCEIFIVHTQFTNVPAGRIIQPGAPRVGDPCIRPYSKSIPVPSFTQRNFLFKSFHYFPLPTTTTTTYAYGVKVIYSVQIFLRK